MSQVHPLPTYNELAEALQNTESPLDPSEAHGLLCGIICSTSEELDESWQKFVIGDKENARSTALLQHLYETSYHEMSDFSFEFSLILPSDSADINSRTETLSLWCQGFLTGLQQSPTPMEERVSEEVIDALNDIVEIAQVNFGDIAESDEDETAYFELVEYVRLVVLMVYHELQMEKNEDEIDDSEPPNILH